MVGNLAKTTETTTKPATATATKPKSHFHKWNEEKLEQLNPLLARKLVWGERTMLAHVLLKKGCIVPEHTHDNEQLTYVLDGALKLTLEGRDVVVRSGEVLVIPPNVPHSAVALEDTLDLDIFTPPRQDWLDKKDDYLRAKK